MTTIKTKNKNTDWKLETNNVARDYSISFDNNFVC